MTNFRTTLLKMLRLCLVGAMVLSLAYTASNLQFGVAPSEPELASFHVRAHQIESATPPTEWPELRIDDLIVDGRRLRFEATQVSPEWTAVEKRSSGMPLSWLYKDGMEPATMRFSGSNVVVVGTARAWSGTLEIQRDNQEPQVLKVRVPSGEEQLIIVEEPARTVHPVSCLFAFVVFALAARIIAPWRNDQRATMWLIFFLCVLHGMFWVALPVGTTNDSRGYLEQWPVFLAGSPDYFPPGYPMFLGFIRMISQEDLGRWVTLVQHVLAVVTAFWTYSLSRRLFPTDLSLLGGILAGTLSPMVTMSQSVMSEIPTVFAMVGALYFGLRAAETCRTRFAVMAGILAGFGGLLRAVPVLVLVPAIGLLILSSSARPKIRLIAITTAVAGGMILLPVAWFACRSHTLAFTNSSGPHLYDRVVFELKQLDATAPATLNLLTILDGEDPCQFPFWDVLTRPSFVRSSVPDPYRLLLSVALEGLAKDPLAYLSYTPGLAYRIYMSTPERWVPLIGDTLNLDKELESAPVFELTASAVRWQWLWNDVHRYVWPWICWMAIAGAIIGLGLRQRQRGLVLALAFVPTCLLLVSAALEIYCPRYNVPTIPFVVVLSIVPLGIVFGGPPAGGDPLSPIGGPDVS